MKTKLKNTDQKIEIEVVNHVFERVTDNLEGGD